MWFFLKVLAMVGVVSSCVNAMNELQQIKVANSGGEIKGIEWSPSGDKILLYKNQSNLIRAYDFVGERLAPVAQFTNAGIVEKISSSCPEINTIAVGSATGNVAFYHGNTYELLDDCYTSQGQAAVKEFDWVGKKNALLIYSKDYDMHQAGFNRWYSSTSKLNLFSRASREVKSYTLDNHVIDFKVNPEGNYVAIVADQGNYKKKLLSTSVEDPIPSFLCKIFSLDAQGNPTLKTTLHFADRVSSLAWSPDSSQLALLLDQGKLEIYNLEGALLKNFLSPSIARSIGEIDWSLRTGLLGVPTNDGKILILNVTGSVPVIERTINLNELFSSSGATFLVSHFLKWSPTNSFLALGMGDLLSNTDMTHLCVVA